MRVRGRAIAILLLIEMIAFPAFADDKADCSNLRGKVAADACSRIIDQGGLKGQALAEIYYSRGVKFQGGGKFDEAIADFTEAIRLVPEDSEYHYSRGVAYNGKGGHEAKAITDFTTAIKLKADEWAAYTQRASSWYQLGDLQKSRADIDVVLKMLPDEPQANEFLAHIHMHQRNFTEAATCYGTVLKTIPKRARSLYGRGLAKIKLGDRQGGDNDINAAVLLEKDVAEKYAAFVRFKQ